MNIKTINQLLDYVETEEKANELINYITNLEQKYEYLKRSKDIMEKYLQLIIDLSYDYDGCKSVDGLKGLIDELNTLAIHGRDEHDFIPIYVNNNKTFNILGEELKGDNNER